MERPKLWESDLLTLIGLRGVWGAKHKSTAWCWWSMRQQQSCTTKTSRISPSPVVFTEEALGYASCCRTMRIATWISRSSASQAMIKWQIICIVLSQSGSLLPDWTEDLEPLSSPKYALLGLEAATNGVEAEGVVDELTDTTMLLTSKWRMISSRWCEAERTSLRAPQSSLGFVSGAGLA